MLAPGVQIPRTLQFSASLDAQLRKGLTLSVGYTGTRGPRSVSIPGRQRSAAAALCRRARTRRTAPSGRLNRTGRQAGDSLQVTLRGQVTRWFNGQTQYTLSRLWNDTNGLNSYPANDYTLGRRVGARGRRPAPSSRPARPGHDRQAARHRHRPDDELGGPVFGAARRGPVQQRPRRRPATRRRSEHARGCRIRAARSSRLARAQAGRQKDAPALMLALDGFNVLNRVNYGTFVGTISSPFFGQPITARPPRQFQFSARFEF